MKTHKKSKRLNGKILKAIKKRSKEKRRKQKKKNKKTRNSLIKSEISNMFPWKEEILKNKLNQDKKINKEKEIQNFIMKKKKLKQDREHMLLKAIKEPLFGKEHRKEENILTKKNLKKIIDVADVLVEVLDARDPLGCRNKMVEQNIIKQISEKTNEPKKLILLISKIDLVPSSVLRSWVKLLEKEFPVIVFRSDSNKQKGLAKREINYNKKSIGTDALLSLLKSYCRIFNSKEDIHVGFIGYPNTGKNTVISELKRIRSIGTNFTPGFTSLQEIQIDLKIKLIECPGTFETKICLYPNLSSESVKIMDSEQRLNLVKDLVSRCQLKSLLKVYKIPEFNSTTEFLYLVAKSKGKLRKGGIPDVSQASSLVLQDWSSGCIPFYVPPPNVKTNRLNSISYNRIDKLNVYTLMEANHDYSTKILQQEKINKVDFVELRNL